jgi:hypothetical protein
MLLRHSQWQRQVLVDGGHRRPAASPEQEASLRVVEGDRFAR